MTQARTTALFDRHKHAGGRMTTFGGWRLPLHYGSILNEARAVRQAVGMFDVSHMGRVFLRGAGALGTLQGLGTNDLSRIGPGRAQYTLWCAESGGVVDDLIVLWTREDEFLVIMNASRTDEDLAHLKAHLAADASVEDVTEQTAMIAVQGPRAGQVLGELGLEDAAGLRRFGVTRGTVAGNDATVSRTGYTGEDGVEIICSAPDGPGVWDALTAAGVQPCGLGARDALRMEMGYPLYGHELGLDISPFEAGVGFAVRMDKDFLGKAHVAGSGRTLVGFVCGRPCVPAPGDEIEAGEVRAVVTSGGTSVVLDAPIGLAFASGLPEDGLTSPLAGRLHNRGKDIDIELRRLPLIERGRPKS